LDLQGLPPEQRQTVLERCTAALLAACSDGEWVVRYAVVAALETLFMQNAAAWSDLLALREALLAALQSLRQGSAADGEVIRRRAGLALERVLQATA
jgi:phycocyanobilin lyase beta subunit